MSERSVTYINLRTGVSHCSVRAELNGQTLSALRTVLTGALAERGNVVAIPHVTDCSITATAIDDALLATLWGTSSAVRRSGRARASLVTLGVVAEPHDSERLWGILHEDQSAVVCPSDYEPPLVPWLAVRPEIGLTLYQDAERWLEDLACGIAWAWLELTRRQANRLSDLACSKC